MQVKVKARPRIGLALGSGSARGWAHIGVIKALAESGIEADIVCGSSVGALVGAALVTGSIDALEDWTRRITWREMVRFLDFRPAGGGLITGKRLMKLFREFFGDRPIESLPLPFAAVATDLGSGREVWLREGPLIEAVRASLALPGLITPVNRGTQRLLDGGLVNPVPVSLCRALGADVIIAVNLNGDMAGRRRARHRARRRISERLQSQSDLLDRLFKEVPGLRHSANEIATQLFGAGPGRPGYFEVVLTAINIMQDQITQSRMAGNPPDVLLVPRLNHIGLLEFNRAEETIAEGRKCVERALPALEDSLGRNG